MGLKGHWKGVREGRGSDSWGRWLFAVARGAPDVGCVTPPPQVAAGGTCVGLFVAELAQPGLKIKGT